MLQSVLRSRTQPWSNLNIRVKQTAYLAQLRAKYDLEDELRLVGIHKVTNTLSRDERDFANCGWCYFACILI